MSKPLSALLYGVVGFALLLVPYTILVVVLVEATGLPLWLAAGLLSVVVTGLVLPVLRLFLTEFLVGWLGTNGVVLLWFPWFQAQLPMLPDVRPGLMFNLAGGLLLFLFYLAILYQPD